MLWVNLSVDIQYFTHKTTSFLLLNLHHGCCCQFQTVTYKYLMKCIVMNIQCNEVLQSNKQFPLIEGLVLHCVGYSVVNTFPNHVYFLAWSFSTMKSKLTYLHAFKIDSELVNLIGL